MIVMKRDDEQPNKERTETEKRERKSSTSRSRRANQLEPRWERLCDQASD